MSSTTPNDNPFDSFIAVKISADTFCIGSFDMISRFFSLGKSFRRDVVSFEKSPPDVAFRIAWASFFLLVMVDDLQSLVFFFATTVLRNVMG